MRGVKLEPMLRDRFTKESDIKKQIRKFLNACGIFHHNNWQGQFSEKGISDLTGIFKGKPLYIEVKVPGFNKNTATYRKQQIFLQRVKDEQGIAILATSVDDVIDALGLRETHFLALGRMWKT